MWAAPGLAADSWGLSLRCLHECTCARTHTHTHIHLHELTHRNTLTHSLMTKMADDRMLIAVILDQNSITIGKLSFPSLLFE